MPSLTAVADAVGSSACMGLTSMASWPGSVTAWAVLTSLTKRGISIVRRYSGPQNEEAENDTNHLPPIGLGRQFSTALTCNFEADVAVVYGCPRQLECTVPGHFCIISVVTLRGTHLPWPSPYRCDATAYRRIVVHLIRSGLFRGGYFQALPAVLWRRAIRWPNLQGHRA